MNNMKTLLTLILVTTFGATALAQNIESHDKIQSAEMGIILDAGFFGVDVDKKMETDTESTVAQLYMFKNSRVKKALAFRTKNDKAKLA